MTHDPSTTRPASEAATPCAPACDALRCLLAAARAVGLYGPEHPAAKARAAEAVREIARATTPGPVRIEVVHGSFRTDGVDAPMDADLRELGAVLDRAGIASIDLCPGLGEAAGSAMAEALWWGVSSPGAAEDLADRLGKASGGAVLATRVDYGRLRMVRADGAGDSPDLGDLVAATLAGGEGDDMVVASKLAAEVGESGRRVGPRDLASAIRQAGASDTARVRTRVGCFVSSLKEDARQGLLTIDPADRDASLKALNDLASVLPVKEVLGALERAETSSRRLCAESAMLLARLAGLASQDAGLVERVRASAAAWRDAGDAPAGLKSALDDLLRLASAAGFNPEDYERQLSRLAGGGAPARAAPGVLAAFEGGEVQRHLAELAAEMTMFAPDMGEAPVKFLLETLDNFIDVGDLSALEDAARVAASTEQGARLLAAITEPARIERIALAAARHEHRIPAACGVLEHAGPKGSAEALIAFAWARDGVARRRTAELVRRYREQPGAMDAFLRGRESLVLAALAALADLLPPDMMLAMTLPRLASATDAGRSAVIRALGPRLPDWPRELLVAALSSRDPEAAGMAIERVQRLPADAGLEVLRAFIEGAYGEPSPALIERAAAALLATGEAGVRGAAELLMKLAFVPTPRAAACARAIARALHPVRDDKAAKRALRAWSISPAKWIGAGSEEVAA